MYAIYNQNTKDLFIIIVCSSDSGRRRSSKNSTRIVVLYLVGKTVVIKMTSRNDYYIRVLVVAIE